MRWRPTSPDGPPSSVDLSASSPSPASTIPRMRLTASSSDVRFADADERRRSGDGLSGSASRARHNSSTRGASRPASTRRSRNVGKSISCRRSRATRSRVLARRFSDGTCWTRPSGRKSSSDAKLRSTSSSCGASPRRLGTSMLRRGSSSPIRSANRFLSTRRTRDGPLQSTSCCGARSAANSKRRGRSTASRASSGSGRSTRVTSGSDVMCIPTGRSDMADCVTVGKSGA